MAAISTLQALATRPTSASRPTTTRRPPLRDPILHGTASLNLHLRRPRRPQLAPSPAPPASPTLPLHSAMRLLLRWPCLRQPAMTSRPQGPGIIPLSQWTPFAYNLVRAPGGSLSASKSFRGKIRRRAQRDGNTLHRAAAERFAAAGHGGALNRPNPAAAERRH
jgi:hypothetical protein